MFLEKDVYPDGIICLRCGKNNEWRLFWVDSEFICIKPRGNKKELLIIIRISSQVLMTYKYISIMRKED